MNINTESGTTAGIGNFYNNSTQLNYRVAQSTLDKLGLTQTPEQTQTSQTPDETKTPEDGIALTTSAVKSLNEDDIRNLPDVKTVSAFFPKSELETSTVPIIEGAKNTKNYIDEAINDFDEHEENGVVDYHQEDPSIDRINGRMTVSAEIAHKETDQNGNPAFNYTRLYQPDSEDYVPYPARIGDDSQYETENTLPDQKRETAEYFVDENNKKHYIFTNIRETPDSEDNIMKNK
jgi:hypothetical protein